MKIVIGVFSLIISFNFSNAQNISLNEISRNIRFDKKISEFNNGPDKINYADIQGTPYYNNQFLKAKIGETSNFILIRYNSFLDTVEVVEKEDVYQLPKEENTPSFTFENTNEKLVFVKTDDFYSGYFFELTSGNFRILKKMITKYFEASPSPNPMIAGTSARFDKQKPLYFIKYEDQFMKVPKNTNELISEFPSQAKKINEFMGKNKLKLNKEEDLIQLGNFLNQ